MRDATHIKGCGGMTVRSPSYYILCQPSSDTRESGTMLLSLIATIALCVLQLLMLRNGAGVDISRVPDRQLHEFSMVCRKSFPRYISLRYG